MTNQKEIYRCEVCGNIVEVLHSGQGQLVCCGQPMKFLEANSVDAATEKHVPVIERKSGLVLVKVGSVEHPMAKEHYIEWIELQTEGNIYKKFLKPNGKAEAEFKVDGNKFSARAYCNLHGLWKSS